MRLLNHIRSFFRAAGLAGCVAALVLSLVVVPTVGCSQADVQKTVALIGAEVPTAIALITDLLPIILAFASSPDSSASGVQAGAQLIKAKLASLQVLCEQYNATPSDDVFQQIVGLVDQLVTTGDTALLELAGVKNTDSQQKAAVVLGSLDAVLHLIDGYVQAVQSTKQVKATAKARSVKLNAVRAYWSAKDKQGIEQAFGYSFDTMYSHEVALGF